MSNPDYGNVPSQPVYGEVKQIEEQQQAAPLAQAETVPAVPSEPATLPVVPEPAAPRGPRQDNITSVLPPLSSAPSNTGQRPMQPNQQLAHLILGTPGMSPITRSFAAQIVGKYRSERGLPEHQLARSAVLELRAKKQAARVATPAAEEE